MTAGGTLDERAFRAIQAAIDETPFRGLPMGVTISNALIIELVGGPVAESWRDQARRRAKWLLLEHIAPARRAPPREVGADCWVGLTSGQTRLVDLVLPVTRALADDCALLVAGRSAPALRHGGPVILAAELERPRLRAWRRDYRRCRRRWAGALTALARRYALDAGFAARMGYLLMRQSQRVASYQRTLAAQRPRAILVDFDRGTAWASLVLAARSLGIPTATLQHGTVGPDYTPVLADRAFCWGALDRERFAAGGTAPHRILLAGCPRLDRRTPPAGEARRRMGLACDRPVVTLGGAAYAPRDSQALAEQFCRALERVGAAVTGVVRPHPSEREETYAEQVRRYPHVRIIGTRDAPLDDAIAATDVMVVYSSGIGSDALVKGRLTVVLDVLDVPAQDHAEDLVHQGGCPRARSAEELARIVAQLLAPTPLRAACEAARERFVERYCAAFGDEAAQRIAAATRHALRTGAFPSAELHA